MRFLLTNVFLGFEKIQKFLELHSEISANARRVHAKLFNERTKYRKEFEGKVAELQ